MSYQASVVFRYLSWGFWVLSIAFMGVAILDSGDTNWTEMAMSAIIMLGAIALKP